LSFHPAGWREVARWLRSPRVGSWLATQERSRFGSCLHLGGRSGEGGVQLDFGGEPGQEREERPRFERFLGAMVEAGLLPPGASVARLVDRFLAEVVLTPGRPPPRSALVIVQDGVIARVPGWRATRDGVYGPIGLSLQVPSPPVNPILSLAVGGGLVELVAISSVDSELATQVTGSEMSPLPSGAIRHRSPMSAWSMGWWTLLARGRSESTGTAPGRVAASISTGSCSSSTPSGTRMPTSSLRRARWPCT
jgi:hypothetical protein